MSGVFHCHSLWTACSHLLRSSATITSLGFLVPFSVILGCHPSGSFLWLVLPCLVCKPPTDICCVSVFFPDGWPDSVREVTSYSLSRDSSSLASLPTNLPEVKPSAIFDSTLKLLSMDLTKACRSCCSSIPLEAVKYLLRCPGNSLSQTPQ